MSRVMETDYEWEDSEEQEFLNELKAEYESVAVDFKGFVAFLDAMEPKRIIADRFFKPRTGEVCAVAAFCRYKGWDDAQMREAAVLSAQQRREHDGGTEDSGTDAATVLAGSNAGLPAYVAADLVWRNDEVWDSIEDGRNKTCTCTGKPGFHFTQNYRCDYGQPLYRDMTPEERWLKLRNFIAKKSGEPLLEAS